MAVERSLVPVLEVANLTKRYSMTSTAVLDSVSFAVGRGEFLTIVGPSGAGKTTLLNVLAQIDTADEGDIWFESKERSMRESTALTPGFGCRIGYVMQDDHLLPWRSVLDNVLLPLQLQRRLTQGTRDRAHELIRAAGLSGFENHYPSQLSGGMRKRVSLIRTLVYDPPVILMDEPFGAVDVQTRAMLQEDLLRLWDAGRKTIVFVTHDIAEAIALGDRTLVLSRAPARIKREHHIPIARPRDVWAIPTHPIFAGLYQAILSDLRN